MIVCSTVMTFLTKYNYLFLNINSFGSVWMLAETFKSPEKLMLCIIQTFTYTIIAHLCDMTLNCNDEVSETFISTIFLVVHSTYMGRFLDTQDYLGTVDNSHTTLLPTYMLPCTTFTFEATMKGFIH